MMRKGRVARLMRLGGMATGLAGDVAGAASHRLTRSADKVTSEIHERAARRMLRVLGEMKGLPLKAGQMLSYIDEMIPPEHRHVYNEVLGQLQTHTPPMEWDDVQELFAEEFDGREPDEVFGSFDHEPIAAASIGQVYRATLHDGTPVVVKVQYPGVDKAFDSDLANLDVLVSAMSAVMRKTDFGLLVGDIVRRVKEECDYTVEAENQRTFRQLWRDDPEVIVPRTIDELCTHRVLVSEYLDGLEWSRMLETADTDLRCQYGTVIFRFVFTSLLVHGVFNGDPHPGNYLFYPDGRVAFIDYGCVQRYSPEQAVAFGELRSALADGTADREFGRLVHRVLPIPEDLDEEMETRAVAYLQKSFEPITGPQPYRYTRDYSASLLREGLEVKNFMTGKLLRGKKAYPIDLEQGDGGFAFLGRIVFGLSSILATLDTEADFRAMVGEMGSASRP